eukprot:6008662-Amphidinium_carterae.1
MIADQPVCSGIPCGHVVFRVGVWLDTVPIDSIRRQSRCKLCTHVSADLVEHGVVLYDLGAYPNGHDNRHKEETTQQDVAHGSEHIVNSGAHDLNDKGLGHWLPTLASTPNCAMAQKIKGEATFFSLGRSLH